MLPSVKKYIVPVLSLFSLPLIKSMGRKKKKDSTKGPNFKSFKFIIFLVNNVVLKSFVEINVIQMTSSNRNIVCCN